MDSTAVFAVFLAGLLQLQQWLLDLPASTMAALSAYATSEVLVVVLVALPWAFFLLSLLIVLRYGQVTFPAPPTSPTPPAPTSLPALVDDADWHMRYGNLDKDNTTLINKVSRMEQNLERLRDEKRHQQTEIEHLERRLRQAHEDLRTAREERQDPTSAAVYVELKDKKDLLEARKAKLDRANKDLSKKLADREAAYQDLLAEKNDLQAKKGALASERLRHQLTHSKVLDLTAECERLDKQLSAAKEAARDAQRTAESREKALKEQRDQARLLDLKARDAAQHQRQLDTKLREQAENGAKELERTLGKRDRTVRDLCGRIQALEEAEKRALDAADSSSRDLKAARKELKDAGRAQRQSLQHWEELKRQAEGKFAAVVSERDAAVKRAQGPAEQHQSSGTGAEIQSLKDQLAGLQKDLSSAQGANQALQAKVHAAETGKSSATGEIQALMDKLASAQKDFSSAQSASQALESKLQTAEKARVSASNEAQKLQQQLSAVQKDLSDAQIAKQELLTKAQAAETGNSSSASEAQGLQDRLVRLQKDLTEAQSAKQVLEIKLQTAEHRNSSSNGEIQTLQNKLASLQKDFSDAQSTNHALQARVQTAETGSNSASNEIQDLKRQMQNAEATFSNVKDENGRLQREVNEAQKKVSDADAENQRLQGMVSRAKDMKTQYEEAKARINQLAANLKGAKAETKQLREAEHDLKKKIQDLDNYSDQKLQESSALRLQIKKSDSEYVTKLHEKDAQLEELDQKLVQALRACINCDHFLWYGQCKNILCPLSDDYMFKDEWNAGNTEVAQNMASLNAYAGNDLFEQHGVETIDEGLGGAEDPATDPAFWNVTAGQDLGEGTQSNMPSQAMDTNEGPNDSAQSNVPSQAMDTNEDPDDGTQSNMPSQAMDTNEGPDDGAQTNVFPQAGETSQDPHESTQSKVSTEAMDTSEGLREPIPGFTREEMEELDRQLEEDHPDTPPTSSANPSNVPGQQPAEEIDAHDLYESFARLRKEDPHDQAFKPPVLSTFTFGSPAQPSSRFSESAGPSVSADAAARSTATARASNTSRGAQNTRARGTKRVARPGNSMASASWPTIDVPETPNAPALSASHVPGQRICPNCGMWALKDDGQCPGNCF
ncbi:hypothetical protein D0864_03677 [Hortaea werneckii]|uniref:Uncharacterized protein n=1 Tax=Hortaea werneckii TaxID=91943 RepID=A0A3M7GIS8_HORWE|nr:hypothetical protein D0864_03677 [Hortaea werneckii]